MKLSTVVMSVVTILLVVFFVVRSGQKDKPTLGAIPSQSSMPDLAARQFAADMRTWLQEMNPSDLKTLNGTGHLILFWEQLKSSDPKRAALIDDYVELRRIGFVKAYTKRPLPIRIATHHDPTSVEFQRTAPAMYRVVIRSNEGLRESFVEISE